MMAFLVTGRHHFQKSDNLLPTVTGHGHILTLDLFPSVTAVIWCRPSSAVGLESRANPARRQSSATIALGIGPW